MAMQILVNRRAIASPWILLLMVMVSVVVCEPVTAGDPLTEGFLSPPQSAKPHVWWHWMKGNVTEEGIERDLEWMKRVGIGGVQYFDAALDLGEITDTPTIVQKPVIYMSREWREVIRYAVETADDL